MVDFQEYLILIGLEKIHNTSGNDITNTYVCEKMNDFQMCCIDSIKIDETKVPKYVNG